ncbi:MAG: ABC transporter permease [Clostridiales Family XIII bacterium]|jgi:ABC-2 type transport system permease protein|nr:ABC transporter permease [Clostridiales Family XIII bacterium]
MKNFWILLRNGLLRGRKTLLLAFVMSLLVAWVGYMVMTAYTDDTVNVVHVAVTAEDVDAPVAKDFLRYLEDDLGMDARTDMTMAEIETALVEKQLSCAITVPAGFEQSLLDSRGDASRIEKITVLSLDDYANEAFLRGYIESYVLSLAELAAGADGEAAVFASLLAEAGEGGTEVDIIQKDTALLEKEMQQEGFSVALSIYDMLCFLIAVLGASMLLADRRDGTYRRLKAGRVTSLEYTAAYCVLFLVFALAMAVVPAVLCVVSGVQTGVPFSVTLFLTVCFSVFIVGLGLLVGVASPTLNGVIGVLVPAATITSMLGGGWFPLDTVPAVFKSIARFMPQYWVNEAVASYQAGDGHLGATAAVLLLAALLLFVLAGIRFASNRTEARVY